VPYFSRCLDPNTRQKPFLNLVSPRGLDGQSVCVHAAAPGTPHVACIVFSLDWSFGKTTWGYSIYHIILSYGYNQIHKEAKSQLYVKLPRITNLARPPICNNATGKVSEVQKNLAK
jgi:hypothetical protein